MSPGKSTLGGGKKGITFSRNSVLDMPRRTAPRGRSWNSGEAAGSVGSRASWAWMSFGGAAGRTSADAGAGGACTPTGPGCEEPEQARSREGASSVSMEPPKSAIVESSVLQVGVVGHTELCVGRPAGTTPRGRAAEALGAQVSRPGWERPRSRRFGQWGA